MRPFSRKTPVADKAPPRPGEFFDRLFSTLSLPPRARNHPGMITLEERMALYALARHYYAGTGIIVDAGIFLGASTACFAEGLRRRGIAEGKLIQSYDLPVCEPVIAPLVAGYYKEGFWKKEDIQKLGAWETITAGANYEAVLRAHLKDYEPLIDLRLGDIRQTLAGEARPVEILFLDVCKNPSLNHHLVRETFPNLIAGHSVVVQQDFFHEHLPWIHMTMGYLKNHFTYLGSVMTSAFFRCEKPIPPDLVESDLWQSSNGEQAVALFDAGLPDTMLPDQHYLVGLARTLMLLHYKGSETALNYLKTLKKPSYHEGGSLPWHLVDAAGIEAIVTGKH